MEDAIDAALKLLATHGHALGKPYLQSGVGPSGGRLYVEVDGDAMSFPQAVALASGEISLQEIRERNGKG